MNMATKRDIFETHLPAYRTAGKRAKVGSGPGFRDGVSELALDSLGQEAERGVDPNPALHEERPRPD